MWKSSALRRAIFPVTHFPHVASHAARIRCASFSFRGSASHPRSYAVDKERRDSDSAGGGVTPPRRKNINFPKLGASSSRSWTLGCKAIFGSWRASSRSSPTRASLRTRSFWTTFVALAFRSVQPARRRPRATPFAKPAAARHHASRAGVYRGSPRGRHIAATSCLPGMDVAGTLSVQLSGGFRHDAAPVRGGVAPSECPVDAESQCRAGLTHRTPLRLQDTLAPLSVQFHARFGTGPSRYRVAVGRSPAGAGQD